VSRDLDLRAALPLADRGAVTALDLQEHYLAACRAHVDREGHRGSSALVLTWWEELLRRARRDPGDLAGLTDWATKRQLLDAYAARHGLDPTHDRLRMVELQYHDVRRDRGLHHRLAAAGRIERIVTEEEVVRAMTVPPEDTRAWLRGETIRRFPAAVVAAGWDSVVLDVGAEGLARLPLPDPGTGSRAQVEGAITAATDAADLLARLGVALGTPGQLA